MWFELCLPAHNAFEIQGVTRPVWTAGLIKIQMFCRLIGSISWVYEGQLKKAAETLCVDTLPVITGVLSFSFTYKGRIKVYPHTPHVVSVLSSFLSWINEQNKLSQSQERKYSDSYFPY